MSSVFGRNNRLMFIKNRNSTMLYKSLHCLTQILQSAATGGEFAELLDHFRQDKIFKQLCKFTIFYDTFSRSND